MAKFLSFSPHAGPRSVVSSLICYDGPADVLLQSIRPEPLVLVNCPRMDAQIQRLRQAQTANGDQVSQTHVSNAIGRGLVERIHRWSTVHGLTISESPPSCIVLQYLDQH